MAILQTQSVRTRVASEGVEIIGSPPGEFTAYIRAEIVKWAKVVKSAGIRPE